MLKQIYPLLYKLSREMLANKVSPASLCSNTKAGHPEMILAGHGSNIIGISGGEESQQSQASLFNSGSELANSMELFSQPYSASHSSISQHSQIHSTAHVHQFNTHTGAQSSRDDGKGVQNVQPDGLSGKQQSQRSEVHNKYYTRYLSAVSLSSKLCKRQETSGVSSTPPAAEGKHGDTAHSKAAFETWKSKQQERLEKQQLIEDVISSTSGYAKELNHTLESLRKEIKEALSPPSTNVQEKSQAEVLTHSMLSQMMQGQTEIKEQLTDLKTLCSQQKAEIAALTIQVSTLERSHTTTLQSTLVTEMTRLEKALLKPCLREIEVQVSQLSEQLRSCTHNQSRSLPATKEADSGTHASHHTPRIHGRGSGTQGSQPRRVQITRKRKSSSVIRDSLSQSLPESRGSHSKPERSTGGVELALSQSSTESLSTPCDIDLTQHSPSGCSQVISHNLQQLKQHNHCQQPPHSTSTSQTGTQPMGETHRAQPAASLSPPRGPVAKRKRPTGRVNRQKSITTASAYRKGKVTATPKAIRRSQRLSKLIQNTVPAELTQEEAFQDSSDEDDCVEQKRALSVARQSSVASSDQQAVQCSSGSGGNVDVLDDWLDFRPPQDASDTADIKPASLQAHASQTGRFQRSSEAARRRLVVTERMSSTLAGSDSVLQELFLSTPSILSP